MGKPLSDISAATTESAQCLHTMSHGVRAMDPARVMDRPSRDVDITGTRGAEA